MTIYIRSMMMLQKAMIPTAERQKINPRGKKIFWANRFIFLISAAAGGKMSSTHSIYTFINTINVSCIARNCNPKPFHAPLPFVSTELSCEAQLFELMHLGFKSHNGPSAESLKMSVKEEPVEADCDITSHLCFYMCSCMSVLCCACRSNV